MDNSPTKLQRAIAKRAYLDGFSEDVADTLKADLVMRGLSLDTVRNGVSIELGIENSRYALIVEIRQDGDMDRAFVELVYALMEESGKHRSFSAKKDKATGNRIVVEAFSKEDLIKGIDAALLDKEFCLGAGKSRAAVIKK